MEVKIYRICEDNPLPTRAHLTDAGWDVYASENVEFQPSEIKLIPLGIIAEAPYGWHFKLCIRSSAALKRGFTQPNGPGVVDHKYRGPDDEIKLMLKAPSVEEMRVNKYLLSDLKVKKGQRMGQLLLEPNMNITWTEQRNRNFAGTSRGGFGSTGV